MHLDTYILDDSGTPVLERDQQRFGEWFEHIENRLVGRDEISPDVSVSTVFLGFDHNFSGRGPPVLWETMIFGGRHDQYQERYSSISAALKGHNAAVALAKGRFS
jgi:hypothetical protein